MNTEPIIDFQVIGEDIKMKLLLYPLQKRLDVYWSESCLSSFEYAKDQGWYDATETDVSPEQIIYYTMDIIFFDMILDFLYEHMHFSYYRLARQCILEKFFIPLFVEMNAFAY